MRSAPVHLNLIESSRRLFELDPGAAVEATPGWLFGAGRSAHPTISNAAFRADDDLDANELLERARSFFAERGRGFAAWTRVGEPADRDLIDAAEAMGLQAVFEMPEMVLEGRAAERPPPDGVSLGLVASDADAEDYWRVAADAYESIGFPPEVFAFYHDHGGLRAKEMAAFLARIDGRPVAIAMAIVSHGTAGIYWVGTTKDARGMGLGSTLTAAAVNAGFDMGADIASLQASPMGESVYRELGFETTYRYRLYMHPSPGGGR